MPSPTKPNTKKMLVQIETDVHGEADKRRRREKSNWARIVTELLRRWVAGANDEAMSAPVRSCRVRTAGPTPEEFQAWHEQKKRDDPAYRRMVTDRIDPASLRWHTSLSAVLQEDALKRGHAVPAGALDGLDRDDDGVDDV